MNGERSARWQQRQRQFLAYAGVYPVSYQKLAGGRSDREWLEAVLAGGARVVQLRDKESDDRALLAKAIWFREKTREAGALFFLNDRVDIALLAGADGVHLGQQDLPAERVMQLAPDLLIGVSCNREEDVCALGRQERLGSLAASYYNIGPLYPTSTKHDLKQFLGPRAIPCFSRHCSLPFTVMGGIKLEHVEELISLGARRIAVVTAITAARDMAGATRLLQQTIANGLLRYQADSDAQDSLQTLQSSSIP